MKKKPATYQVSSAEEISPRQALQFLEDMRVLYSAKDEPTKAISIRIPENILRLLKTRAAADGMKYQSLIIRLLRDGLSSDTKRK